MTLDRCRATVVHGHNTWKQRMNQDKNHISDPKTEDSEEGRQGASTNAEVGGAMREVVLCFKTAVYFWRA